MKHLLFFAQSPLSALKLLNSKFRSECLAFGLVLLIAMVIHIQCFWLRRTIRDLNSRRQQIEALWRSMYTLCASTCILNSAVGSLDWIGVIIVSRIISMCLTRIIIDILEFDDEPTPLTRQESFDKID